MLVFKAMEQCSVAEAVLVYNRGFSGYFFDQSKTPDTLIWKMGKEELSPAHSLVAFVNGEPAGIVLNGIWNRGGRKIGWNGGTGVAPKHRRSGVGQALIEATLQIYREQGVELAALVAISRTCRRAATRCTGGFLMNREGKRLPCCFSVKPVPDEQTGRRLSQAHWPMCLLRWTRSFIASPSICPSQMRQPPEFCKVRAFPRWPSRFS